MFFIGFIVIASIWAMDIYEFIDPFKIYKPAVITIFGWTFLISITIASLFVYRPWCTMFCPFGLVSWFFEKLAIFKIKVNYDTCIECQSCARACPTTVMEVILKRETKTIPDCFACAGCIDACPTDSIPFSSGKRKIPLADKYKKE